MGESIELTDYSNDKELIEKMKETEPDRVIHQQYITDHIYYTPTEFFEKIQEEIKRLEKSLEELEKEIQDFEKTTTEIYSKMQPLLEYLDTLGGKYGNYKRIVSETIKRY